MKRGLCCLFLVLGLSAAADSASAQIQSSAFDPNCYQPQIGIDIDTIMGRYNGQMLSSGINIGPSPDDPGGPGRIVMYNLPESIQDSGEALLYPGPNFDPHHLNLKYEPGLHIPTPFVSGHFRSQKYLDLLSYNNSSYPRIYWESDSGTYAPGDYTVLKPETLSYHTLNYFITPYHAFLTSDTVEDIVFGYSITTADGLNDSDRVSLCLYRGGANLFRPDDTLMSMEHVFLESETSWHGRGGFIGNFRGTGREDYVSFDGKGNLFFYPNDLPFSLSKFAASLIRDTLLAYWMAPWTFPSTFNADWSGSIAKVFNPEGADDLLLWVDSAEFNTDYGMQIRIARGGPDFGTSRLNLDKCPVIHEPGYFDGGNFRLSGWGGSITDCGDMTGSGDHVLYVEGGFGHDEMFHTFYVLGNSFDEKVDMYIQEDDGGGVSVDTATLDGDRLQDVVIGAGNFPWLTVNGQNDRGTILFVHGTDKIPHKLASVIREEEAHPKHQGDPFSVSQSEDGNTILIHAWHGVFLHSTATLYDLLGRTVGSWEESSPKIDWRIAIPPHPGGAYVLAVTTDDKVFTYKLALLK